MCAAVSAGVKVMPVPRPRAAAPWAGARGQLRAWNVTPEPSILGRRRRSRAPSPSGDASVTPVPAAPAVPTAEIVRDSPQSTSSVSPMLKPVTLATLTLLSPASAAAARGRRTALGADRGHERSRWPINNRRLADREAGDVETLALVSPAAAGAKSVVAAAGRLAERR